MRKQQVQSHVSGGFALPAVLLAIVIMSVLTTGAFFSTQQEFRAGSASRGGTEAFYVAERGLADVMSNWDAPTFTGLAPWTSVTVADTVEDGDWSVTVTKGSDRIFYLDATGTAAHGGVAHGGANRRLGAVVRISTADIEPRAALTTRNNAEVKGNAEVHGGDVHPPHWQLAGMCNKPKTDKPGIMIDDASDVGTKGQGTITGDPAVAEDPSIGDSTFTQFGDLNWNDLTGLASKYYSGGALNQLLPRYNGDGSCDSRHPLNWGDPMNPLGPCGSYFPIIHISGDASIQSGSRGQGILLVDGNLDLRGNFIFHGIVIVQGNFETQGSGNRIFGAVMANNADFENQSIVGGSVVQWSSCAVQNTLMNISSLMRAELLGERSWVDLSAVLSGI